MGQASSGGVQPKAEGGGRSKGGLLELVENKLGWLFNCRAMTGMGKEASFAFLDRYARCFLSF